jgi:hypothetical protein
MVRLSTDLAPERDRIVFWNEVVSRHFMDCRLEHAGGAPPHSKLRDRMVGDIALAVPCAGSHPCEGRWMPTGA